TAGPALDRAAARVPAQQHVLSRRGTPPARQAGANAAPAAAPQLRCLRGRLHQQSPQGIAARPFERSPAKARLAIAATALERLPQVVPARYRQRDPGLLAARLPAELENARLIALRRVAA